MLGRSVASKTFMLGRSVASKMLRPPTLKAPPEHLFMLNSCMPHFRLYRIFSIKSSSPWVQKFYTPLVLERGSKRPWQYFPPAVVVYDILSPTWSQNQRLSRVGGDNLKQCLTGCGVAMLKQQSQGATPWSTHQAGSSPCELKHSMKTFFMDKQFLEGVGGGLGLSRGLCTVSPTFVHSPPPHLTPPRLSIPKSQLKKNPFYFTQSANCEFRCRFHRKVARKLQKKMT